MQFECLAQTVRHASRELTRQYEAALRPAELNAGQFTLLTCLNQMGCGVPAGTMAALLGYEQSTVTRLVGTLSQRGLVDMVVDAEDGRRRLVTLTELGQDVMHRAEPLWSGAQERTLARLSDAQREQLRHLLRLVVGA